ncbi:MAG: hypothetical protein ABEI86_05130, partial [Halobacteriaceae archaeon]
MSNSSLGGARFDDTNGEVSISDSYLLNGSISGDYSNTNVSIHNTTFSGPDVTGIKAQESRGNWKLKNISIISENSPGVVLTESSGDWQLENVYISSNHSSPGLIAKNTPGKIIIDNSIISDVNVGVITSGLTDIDLFDVRIFESDIGIINTGEGGSITLKGVNISHTYKGISTTDSNASWTI